VLGVETGDEARAVALEMKKGGEGCNTAVSVRGDNGSRSYNGSSRGSRQTLGGTCGSRRRTGAAARMTATEVALMTANDVERRSADHTHGAREGAIVGDGGGGWPPIRTGYEISRR